MGTPFDVGKATFINFNLWRANLGLPYAGTPPALPFPPGGSSVVVVTAAPLVCRWEFLPPNPVIPLYVAAWCVASMRAPGVPPPISKMRWIGNVSMVPAVNFSLQSALVAWGKFWPGCFLSLGLAAGYVGAPPFQGLRVGTYI